MKLVRAVAILVGLADLAFGIYFMVSAGSMDTVSAVPEYARWVGVCSLASAALLFLIASDPERYFPVLFVATGGRALVAIIAIPAVTRQIHMVISESALAAVVVLVIIHAIKERRAAAGEGGDAKSVVKSVAKDAAKPDKKSDKA
jgi:hypothetical protein